MRRLAFAIGILFLFQVHAYQNQIIVKTRKPNQLSVFQKVFRSGVRSIVPFKTDPQLLLVQAANSSSEETLLKKLNASSDVVFAERNVVVHTFGQKPSDPDFHKQWALYNSQQKGSDIHALPVWTSGVTGRKDLIIAVIDSGVDLEHPDLKQNVFVNPGEIPNNGIDDDKNGFVDDVNGWNFVEKTNDPSDDLGHGSHCAGNIGAAGNNGIGIAGVNWNVSILPVKFINKDGVGTVADAIESINYARMMKAQIMSNSWGGQDYLQSLQEAVAKARDAGILFVAAAGNDGASNDEIATYPANFDLDNIVAVAATDDHDKIAEFSNYSSTKVHIAVPGVKIYSLDANHGYVSLSGTSMATAVAAGAAGLLKSAHPEWSYSQLKDRMIRGSDPITNLRRKSVSRGRLNVFNALNGIFPPYNEPNAQLWVTEHYEYETQHPYAANMDINWKVRFPGAKYLRFHFTKFSSELYRDVLTITDATGQIVEQITGERGDSFSDYIAGDSADLRFKTDYDVEQWGFKIGYVQVIR